jgi:hypothetical protein
VIGAGGVLYGTALDESGTVYSLAPPATEGEDWSYSVLDGSIGCGPSEDAIGPCTGVAIGSGGVLYGTVYWGGTTGGGMVYSLAPPASSGGSWTQTFLYSFPYLPNGGSDGYRPDTPVVIGAGGVVFSLTPPATPGGVWTETILHSFAGGSDGANPTAPVAIGQGGILLGTTYNGGTDNKGTVYALAPPATPGGASKETVLYNFTGASDGANPQAGLTLSNTGVIYGTTYAGGGGSCTGGCGTVFSLQP